MTAGSLPKPLARSPGLRRALWQIIAALLLGIAFYFLSRQNYLLFHGIVESFSFVIAATTFAIAWNSRHIVRNGYLLFVGIAFLAVAVVDLFHTLAYYGMGVFPGYDANLPTQLWIAGRYLLSLALLIAPFTVGRRLSVPAVLVGFVAADLLIFAVIFTGIFPTAYITGIGLTSFKIASEYVVSFFFLLAIFFLLRKRHALSPDLTRMMVAALVVSIVSEMAFTLYTDVYGITNMIGHLFKVVAYFLVYKALVETSLVKPYDSLFRELKKSETSLAAHAADLTAANSRLTREIIERRKAETEIVNQEKRYRDTLENMLEGCQIIDFDWKYIYVNSGAGRHGRMTQNAPIGRTMMEVYPGIENTPLFARLKRCMQERTPYRMENEFVFPDGSRAWFELSIQPVPEGIFILSLDISERKQAEKLKDEFLGMVSHELKNPLTVIIGALSTITGGGIPESESKLLMQDAVAEAGELSVMIDNLLELSRQQARHLVLRTEPVDLHEMFAVVTRKLDVTRIAGHRLIAAIPDDFPLLTADRLRVERILYNLIDNAVKYSPDGGDITVAARVDRDQAVVSVADSGIGISPEDQSRLFQSFERLGGTIGYIKGTGLGLRVCRILVEAHGGRIWVESQPRRGSTFYFTLPITA